MFCMHALHIYFFDILYWFISPLLRICWVPGVWKLTNVVVRSLLIKQRVRKGFFFVFLFFLPLGKKDLLHVLAHNLSGYKYIIYTWYSGINRFINIHHYPLHLEYQRVIFGLSRGRGRMGRIPSFWRTHTLSSGSKSLKMPSLPALLDTLNEVTVVEQLCNALSSSIKLTIKRKNTQILRESELLHRKNNTTDVEGQECSEFSSWFSY